jgi:hypothetical protein
VSQPRPVRATRGKQLTLSYTEMENELAGKSYSINILSLEGDCIMEKMELTITEKEIDDLVK